MRIELDRQGMGYEKENCKDGKERGLEQGEHCVCLCGEWVGQWAATVRRR